VSKGVARDVYCSVHGDPAGVQSLTSLSVDESRGIRCLAGIELDILAPEAHAAPRTARDREREREREREIELSRRIHE